MCDKCIEFDRKIEHHQRLVASITDQLTFDRFNQLIKDTEAKPSFTTTKKSNAASVGGFFSLQSLAVVLIRGISGGPQRDIGRDGLCQNPVAFRARLQLCCQSFELFFDDSITE